MNLRRRWVCEIVTPFGSVSSYSLHWTELGARRYGYDSGLRFRVRDLTKKVAA